MRIPSPDREKSLTKSFFGKDGDDLNLRTDGKKVEQRASTKFWAICFILKISRILDDSLDTHGHSPWHFSKQFKLRLT